MHEEIRLKHEAKFRSLAETSHDWIWELDLSGKHTYSNARVKDILGYEIAEFLAMNMFDLLHPEDGANIQLKFPQLIAQECGWQGWVLRWRNKDGIYRFLESTAAPVFNMSGVLVGYHGIDRDITRRKRIEEALQESEISFRGIFENAADAILLVGHDGRVRQANPEACRLHGYTLDEFIGKHGREWVHPEHLWQFSAALATVQGGGKYSVESVNLHKDGTPILIEVRISPLVFRGESVLFGMLRDISQRKRVEEALRNERERLRTIIDTVADPIFVKDNDHRIILANKAFCTLVEQTEDAVIGKTLAERFPAAEQAHFVVVDRQVLDTGIPDQREEVLTVNGVTRTLSTRKTRFVETTGEKFLVGSIHDTTEIKRTQAELTVAKAIAERANHAKSRFLAAASHDLRQPMAALSLFVDVLHKKAPPDCAPILSKVDVCIKNLTELITDLLDISKLDTGVVTPQPADFSIDDLLGNVHSLYRDEARAKGLHLRVRGCAAIARTDPLLLKRILGNLVGNAIRYTHQGGVLIACRRQQGKPWVEVWDTGIGIPVDQTESIFEEFYQLGDPARNQGSGLGLAIVAKSAALLGLKVRVGSRAGRGSMFAIELPLSIAPQLSTEPQPTRPPALRIGLVEDHPQVLEATVLALESVGHTVLAGTTGTQMLQGLGDTAPDIVISDYRLGEGNTGLDVIEAARARFGAALPAFVITGDTDPGIIAHLTAKGIGVHFKPLPIERLQGYIHHATKGRCGGSTLDTAR